MNSSNRHDGKRKVGDSWKLIFCRVCLIQLIYLFKEKNSKISEHVLSHKRRERRADIIRHLPANDVW